MSKEAKVFEGDKVAVYGTLRKGHGNHRLLESSEFLGEEKLPGHGMVSLGGFPAVYTSENDKKSVVVEVFKVDGESTKKRLDMLEGYPSFYDRKLVKTSHGDAWMYVIESYNEKSERQVEGGDWNEHEKSRVSSWD